MALEVRHLLCDMIQLVGPATSQLVSLLSISELEMKRTRLVGRYFLMAVHMTVSSLAFRLTSRGTFAYFCPQGRAMVAPKLRRDCFSDTTVTRERDKRSRNPDFGRTQPSPAALRVGVFSIGVRLSCKLRKVVHSYPFRDCPVVTTRRVKLTVKCMLFTKRSCLRAVWTSPHVSI